MWTSTNVGLVSGDRADPMASSAALVDTANGFAVRCPSWERMVPDVDLTVRLFLFPMAGRALGGLGHHGRFRPVGVGRHGPARPER